MAYFTLGHRLPHWIASRLYGDRKKFGLKRIPDDPCWKEWETAYLDFYYNTQKKSVGAVVNDAGYRVMNRLIMSGKKVLEVGPGDIDHIKYWRGHPSQLVIADIKQEMLDRSTVKLKHGKVNYKTQLLPTKTTALPFADDTFDLVVTFYSLEHLFPLKTHLKEIHRVLKPGGKLVGAIPSEGGLAWGMGRFLTSRNWLLKNTHINPDKIICWEHPNFADGILKTLDSMFQKTYLSFWPLAIPSVDLNLIIKFIYKKSGS